MAWNDFYLIAYRESAAGRLDPQVAVLFIEPGNRNSCLLAHRKSIIGRERLHTCIGDPSPLFRTADDGGKDSDRLLKIEAVVTIVTVHGHVGTHLDVRDPRIETGQIECI